MVYLQARSAAADAADATDAGTYADQIDQARDLQHASWIIAGVAGVGAAVSGYLWYRALRAPAPIEVAPTAGGVAFGWSTSF